MKFANCFRIKVFLTGTVLTGALALAGGAVGQNPVRPIVLPWSGVAPNPLEAALAASDSAMLTKKAAPVAAGSAASAPAPAMFPARPAQTGGQVVASTADASAPA